MQINDVVLGLSAGVGIDLSPDGKTAYYVEWSIGELAKVDTATGMVTKVMTGLKFPQDVEVDWDTGDIYVSERNGSIVKIVGKEKKAGDRKAWRCTSPASFKKAWWEEISLYSLL